MTCDYHLLPHAGIQSLAPYIPGKSVEEVAREQGLTDVIKLASNENPLGCSPKVLQSLATMSPHQVSQYPSPNNHPLRKKLADKLSVDVEMLTFGNGSDSLFSLCLACFALHNDKHILVSEYGFITYEIQAKTLGIPVISIPIQEHWKVDIKAMVAACNEKTALIFLANPNNPTASLVSYQELLYLLENIPETTILVLDEAYHEFLEHLDTENSLALIARYPNLIITRTFSKAYGLAGLRLGYAVASPAITALLQRVSLPFQVNQAALVAAHAALDDEDFIDKTIVNNRRGLKQLSQGLTNLKLSYLPPCGNFITLNYKKDGNLIYQELQRYGIIVRPLHPYGLNNYLRITVGTQQQNNRFLETLTLCMQNEKEDTPW